MQSNLPFFLSNKELFDNKGDEYNGSHKIAFLDRTLQQTAATVKSMHIQAETSQNKSFLFKINPHIKLFSLIYFVVIISLVHNIPGQAIITASTFMLFVFSGLKILNSYKKILLLSFLFGLIIILPASLNIITKGKIIFNIIEFDEPSRFWIYDIPKNIGITDNGVRVVSLFFLRVLNSISFSFLIVLTTSFPALIKSLRIVAVPDTFQMIIILAYKYIFLLSKTIEETYMALKSRLIGNFKSKNIRSAIGGKIFFIFRKSKINYENTYMAMVSRGYSGKIYLHSKNTFLLKDFITFVVIVVYGIGVLFI